MFPSLVPSRTHPSPVTPHQSVLHTFYVVTPHQSVLHTFYVVTRSVGDISSLISAGYLYLWRACTLYNIVILCLPA